MEFSDRVQQDIKSQIKSGVRIDARVNRELDKFCTQYRKWAVKEKKGSQKPPAILAEGDSWFRYILHKAVISHLEDLLGVEILNLARPGDETEDMLAPKQRARLIRELKKGVARNWKFDYLLFSGGGNDLVGKDRFHKWLKPYEEGMTAVQLINTKTLKAALLLVELTYEELIEIRDVYSQTTQIVFHGYDFAIPNGKGVCGRGPWMEPGLIKRGIPAKLRNEVVQLFLTEFGKMLKRLAKKHVGIIVVNTQGTLTEKEWANELHPRSPGFKKIARLFKEAL